MESTLPKRHEDHIEEKRNIERSPQFGAQTLSDATSDGNSRCESRSGQGMEEAPPAWHVDKMRSKKEVILEAPEEKNSPLCSVDGHLSSKNAKLEQKYLKDKDQVVLQNNTVKNDSGSYAVFTGQCSSASQMTAAKEMALLRDYLIVQDKQQTQHSLAPKKRWKTLPICVQIPKSECPDF